MAEKLDEVIDELLKLKKYICQHKGNIDFPCIFCDDCPDGINVPQIYEFENGIGKKTINSSILSIKIPLQDEVERFLLRRLMSDMGGRHKLIMKEPEDGYEISFFISDDIVRYEEERERIKTFILNFPDYLRMQITYGKSNLNKWIRQVSNEIYSKITGTPLAAL
jgi:hypothetical protein